MSTDKDIWNFPVPKELNEKTFQWAHRMMVPKSQFIRTAVEEKIKRLEGELRKTR